MSHWVNLIMQDDDLRKEVGNRIKQLRKQKGWTQKELAKHIDGSYQQLNKYESGIHSPPLDKLVQLASVLGTSTDYLIVGQHTDQPTLHNKRLLQRFQMVEEFNEKERETVITLIDAMIAKQKMEDAVKALGR